MASESRFLVRPRPTRRGAIVTETVPDTPLPEEAEDIASAPSFGRLLGLARPYLRPLLAATFLLLLGGAVSLVTPKVAGDVVDAAITHRSVDQLNRIVIMLIGLFAIMGVIAFGELYLLRLAGARLLQDLRSRLFAHLIQLSPDFYETRRVGELLSRMGSDLTVVQNALTQQIPGGIQAVLRFVGTLVILLVMQTQLTLVSLAVIPPVVLVGIFYGRRLEKLATAERDAVADTAAVAEETLSGIRTVQAFGRESFESDRYGDRLLALLGVQLRNARATGAFMGLLQFAAFSAFALVLWFGGRLMLRDELTAGELTTFLLYTFSIASSVGTLGALYGGYRELRGASARIFDLLDTLSTIQSPLTPVAIAAPRGEVVFEDVEFAYASDPDTPAISALDLQVKSGEVVGVVGPSGAGKSTLFSLLLRFHDPRRGRILLDGHDLRSLDLSELRQSMAIVPQEIFLFHGTVEENIGYSRPGASAYEVRQAAEAAGAHEFIERLPQGYQEVVGERGVRLSAGQRQRVAIARAFLKNPRVLLLDEATSSLDPDSEQRVQMALDDLLRGRTTLVIAHRLATARKADRIVVLDQGELVGSGTHDELYASSEIYRRYWRLQSLRDQQDPPEADALAN